MDSNPEQLSQTVDTQPKRAFMRKLAEKGSLGMSWPREFGKRVANAALDILGPEGQLRPDEEGAPMNGRFERSYRYTVVDTLGGGASEIQKNIIARRGLGLPPTC